MPVKTRVNRRRFYDEALSEAERADLPVALQVDGVDQEIAMLRLRLRTAVKERPEDVALMLKGIDVLRKMVAMRYKLPRRDQRDFEKESARLRDEIAAIVAEREG